MPCYPSASRSGVSGIAPSGGFATEEECLQECVEGACCQNGVCSIKPKCQCNGQGAVFMGEGVSCSPDPCNPLP